MTEIAARQSGPMHARASLDWIAASITCLAAFALFLLALVPRLWLAWLSGLDGLYGQDAYAYYDYARQMYAALAHMQLPPPFWWPLGYPALLTLGFLTLGTGVRAAQIITLVSGALVAPLTFLLTREAMPGSRANIAGLVAGAIVALGGQLVQSSVVIMADAPALMWATLSAWLLIRYRRSNNVAALALSAMAMALAVMSRWENLGFALVWLGANLAPGPFRNREGMKIAFSLIRRKLGPPLLIALGLAALVFLPQLVYKVEYAAPIAGQSWVEGWSPANFFSRSFDTVDGHFDYGLPVAIFNAQVFFHPAYIFPLLTPFLIIGAWLFAKRARTDPATFTLLVGWCALLYLFLAGIPYENFRFGLGFLVPAAVLAGTGVAWAFGKLSEKSPPAPPSKRGKQLRAASRLALLALLALALAGTAAWETRVLQPVLAEKQMELTDAQWLSARVPATVALYTFGVTEALQTYSPLSVKDLSEESPDRIVADVRADSRAYLFVDATNIETQWHGKVLEQNLQTLRDQVGLQELGRIDRFTLFLVGAAP